jgi:hypothetical protein
VTTSATEKMLERAFVQLDAAIEMDDPPAVSRLVERIFRLMDFVPKYQ